MLKSRADSKVLSILSAEVITKARLKQVQPSDCRWLSHEIQRVTEHFVSETTLKRFFGFAASQYQLSGFTKNVLSQYLGFSDWQDYLGKHALAVPEVKAEKSVYWETLQKKARKISLYTFQALKNRSGIPFDATIDRKFAETHIAYFLESPYLATSLVAPGGYGKSIALTRLVDKFWLGKNPLYTNDILWFVSGQTLGGLLNLGFDLDAWFMHQVGLVEEENIREYFGKNPREIHGRLIMILDGFDEIMHKDEQAKAFFARILDFITVNQEYKWIKIILSVRSYTWENIVEDATNTNFIKENWYLGTSCGGTNLINVPLLKEEEITTILNNLFEQPRQSEINLDLFTQLSYPFYVQLLFQLQRIDPDKGIVYQRFNYFDLVSEFIMKKIYQTRYSSEKVSLIKRFLEYTQSGKKQDYMHKDLLVPESGDFKKAYTELLSYGVLVEETLSTSLSLNKTVYFNHTNLLEYFIAMEMLTIHSHHIGPALFQDVDTRFLGSKYRVQIMKWLIYYAVTDNQMSGLDCIRELSINPGDKEHLTIALADTLKSKYFDDQGSIRKTFLHLLPFKGILFSNLVIFGSISPKYEQALGVFSELSPSAAEKVFFHASLALKALYQLNARKMKTQLELIETIGSYDSPAFGLDPYKLLSGLFNYYSKGILNESLLKDVANYLFTGPTYDTAYKRLTHSILFSYMVLIPSAEFSMRVVGAFYPRPITGLFKIRHFPIHFLYLAQISYMYLTLDKKDEFSRLMLFIRSFRDFHPSGYLNAYYRLTYEILLAKQAFLENEPELAMLNHSNVLEIAAEADLPYMRIFAERNLVMYYQQTGQIKEERQRQKLIRAEVRPQHFQLEYLMNSPHELGILAEVTLSSGTRLRHDETLEDA